MLASGPTVLPMTAARRRQWLAMLAALGLGAAAPCRAGAQVLRVVTIFPRSGSMATGLSPLKMTEGVRLAVDEINQRGGILGRQVELIELDSQSTPLAAKAAAMAAVKLQPLAVIGDRISSLSLAIAPILQEAKIIMITPLSTHPGVTQIGDYIFRMCLTDSFQGKALAQFAHADLKLHDAAILTNASQKYSAELSRQFGARFRQLGGRIVFEGDYLQDTSDFSVLLEQVKARAPSLLFIPGYAKDAGALMRQARQMGINAVFLGGDGWGMAIRDYAGPAITGSYHLAHWHRDLPSPASLAFVQRFQRRFGKIKSDGEVMAYDAMFLLADAARRANSAEPARVRDALAATDALAGITGTIRFDAQRNPIKSAAIVREDEAGVVFFKVVEADPQARKP